MQNRTVTKIIAMLLLVSTVFLFACSESTGDAGETTAETAASSTEETTEETTEITRSNYPDTLPAGLDFGGATFRILTMGSVLASAYLEHEMVVEELTGEVVNDSIYERATTVGDRLNVVLEEIYVENTANTMKTAVTAGDDICELGACYAYYITPLALTGSFYNWLDIKYVDLEMPWWPSSLSEDLVINNRLYFISGDISLKLLQYTYCMFFNQTIADDWNVPDLYNLVLDGKWTLDKYIEIASSVSSDLNGDGKYTKDDLFGTINGDITDARIACFDLPLSSQNDDGTLELVMMSEKFVDVYSKIYDYYSSSNSVFKIGGFNNESLFAEDHLLFFPFLIVGAEDLRDMESDYGIIPWPKYDEAQESYYTLAHDNYSLMCVPVTVSSDELDMVGAVTEAMAAESYRSVTPAYLEVAMKNKFLRDENSQAMLDLITTGVQFDPAVIYSNSLGDVLHLQRGIFAGTQDITSTYKKNEKIYLKSFEKFNDKYLSIDD